MPHQIGREKRLSHPPPWRDPTEPLQPLRVPNQTRDGSILATIIAAIVVGLLLLWGGIVALLRMVELFERKHVLALGGYTSLVAGLVMGLVLFNSNERQKQHRAELQDQVNLVTQKLSELSERLVSQLAEKSELTASEFQIRANLQKERSDHERTRQDLAQRVQLFDEMETRFERERNQRRAYQDEINRQLQDRFKSEDERYKGIRDFLEIHRRTIGGIQIQLASVQDDVTRLNTQVSSVVTNQTNLLGKINSTRQITELTAQKIDALSRSHAALYDDLNSTMAQVDSLYTWKTK